MKTEKYFLVASALSISILVGVFFYFPKSKKYVPAGQPDFSGNGSAEENAEQSPLPKKVLLNVPFTSQAPFGNWQDVREQNGCEEASLLMVISWARGEDLSPETAAREIQNMSDYHLKAHGHFHDLSNADTLQLLNDYFNYFKARL